MEAMSIQSEPEARAGQLIEAALAAGQSGAKEAEAEGTQD
jgi:hypothetical protein